MHVRTLSFARTMHYEATETRSVTACGGPRECKQPSAPGEVPVQTLSDGGSTPPTSTKNKGHPSGWLLFWASEGVESCPHMPQGMCMSRCKHRQIPSSHNGLIPVLHFVMIRIKNCETACKRCACALRLMQPRGLLTPELSEEYRRDCNQEIREFTDGL